jgi:hypothetical protein
MSVVDLATGRPVSEAPEEPTLLNSLKAVIAAIESGELKAERFYLIVDGGTQSPSFDSGLTASDAIVMLEREKFHILCALAGVNV